MSRDHSRPTSSQLRTESSSAQRDPPAAEPSHAERCRTLIAAARTATLCSIAREPDGYPYGSLVTVAFDSEGQPLLLLSALAEHTGNLAARPEASLLVAEALGEGGDPLALGRATLLGKCRKITGEPANAARERFLAAHARAAFYVDFKDFAFYRLEVEAVRYIGGFGRMSWVSAEEYKKAAPDPLAAAAAGILSHMNEDHADAVLAYAKGLLSIADASAATMTAVDRYGFEMTVMTADGPRAARLAFDAPVATTEEVRHAMVSLVKAARARA
jgi:heme iron utilization protein